MNKIYFICFTQIQKIILCIFLFVCILCFSVAGVISEYSYRDETRSADAAIVLGASVFGSEPSPVFRERINHAIWLYKNKFIKSIILTGWKSIGNTLSDALIAKDYALKNGIPESAILVEELSTKTQENITFAKEVWDLYGFNTYLLVSDPIHMKRSISMARDQIEIVYSSPTRTSMYRSFSSRFIFLMRETYYMIGYSLKKIKIF